MFYVEKTFEVSASHQVNTDNGPKCEDLHGHNYKITVCCKSKELNNDGMIVDFTDIKKIVKNKIDHKHLNDIFKFNPTTENLAKWIVDNVPHCYKAIVWETSNNKAIYEKDE